MTANFSSAPYYDDFSYSKGYYRVMFTPEVAVQARELTTLQTILNQQAKIFGDSIYQNGAVIVPGGLSLDLNLAYATLNSLSNIASLDDLTLVGATSGAVATVINYAAADSNDPNVIYLKYSSGVFVAGENLYLQGDVSHTTLATVQTSTGLSNVSPIGYASAVSIAEGIFYVNGFFALVDPQTIILDKFDQVPTLNIGLVIEESFITALDDPTLNDPANGFSNFNAPGADRYAIILTLFAVDPASPLDPNFITLMSVVNGIIQTEAVPTVYSIIGDTLAQRTAETNGNFTVSYFPATLREDLNNGTNNGLKTLSEGGDSTKFDVCLSPGIAYVDGYRNQTLATTYIPVAKARTTARATNLPINFGLGPYVQVTNILGLFNTTAQQVVKIQDTNRGGGLGSQIGTAKVRAMQYVSGTIGTSGAIYNLWLYDISMTGGHNFITNAKALYDSSTSFAMDLVTPVVLYQPDQNIAIVENPHEAVEGYQPLTDYLVRREITFTTDGSGNAIISSGSVNFVFRPYSTADYAFSKASGVIQTPSSITGSGTSTITISGLTATTTYTALVTFTKTIAPPNTKQLQTNVEAGLTQSSTIQLHKADIYQLISVTDDGNAGADITSRYTLDNGERDNYYDRGSLLFNANAVPPLGTVTATYQYFTHGSAGDYFSVDSYTGQVDYEDIPAYTASTGVIFQLRDCLDFRPRVVDAGGSFSVTPEIPVPGNDITVTFDYYLSRIDKLYMTRTGDFRFVTGTPAISPATPPDPDDGMLLYILDIPAYTFNVTDIGTTLINNKRYTMQDIGLLDRRISNLEYYTSLNVLEQQTQFMFVDDGSGDAIKLGTLTDNFTTFLSVDTFNPDNNFSFDLQNGELHPRFYAEAVPLTVSGSSHIQETGGFITLPYTLVTALAGQPTATQTTQVNPYGIQDFVGSITLSPDTDIFYDINVNNEVVDYTFWSTFFEYNGNTYPYGVIWNYWTYAWVGQPVNSASQATPGGSSLNLFSIPGLVATTSGGVTRQVFDTPYIKSQTISFSAVGMKPNTTLIPFFDGIEVTADVSPFPLVTNSVGSVSGTFTIPANSFLRFNAGQRVFYLTDNADNTLSTTNAGAIFECTGQIPASQDANTISCRTPYPYSFNPTYQLNSSVRPHYRPLTQIFHIPSEYNANGTLATAELNSGAFLAEIQVAFAVKDATLPITLQLREVQAGVVTDQVIPFSSVTLFPGSITTSSDGSVLTNFVFPAPVYIDNQFQVALCLITNSPNYEVFISKQGDINLGGISNSKGLPVIGWNLGTDSLYFPGMAKAWTSVSNQALEFNVLRCSFDTTANGTVTFSNSSPSTIALENNPFITTNTSTTVQVLHPNHGLVTGYKVTLSGATGTLNGIPAANINGTRIVTVINRDTYTVVAGSAATVSGQIGGSTIIASRCIRMDIAVLNPTGFLIGGPRGTAQFLSETLDYTIGTTEENQEFQTQFSSGYDAIVPGQNYVFDLPREILDTQNLASPNTVSLVINATLSSQSEKLSPILDASRMNVIAISNKINDDVTGENSVSGGNAETRYITKIVSLATSAENLQVFLDVSRYSSSDVNVYAKTYPVDSLSSPTWTLMTPTTYPQAGSLGSISGYVFALTGLASFDKFAIKVVPRANFTTQIPVVHTFRAVAY